MQQQHPISGSALAVATSRRVCSVNIQGPAWNRNVVVQASPAHLVPHSACGAGGYKYTATVRDHSLLVSSGYCNYNI